MTFGFIITLTSLCLSSATLAGGFQTFGPGGGGTVAVGMGNSTDANEFCVVLDVRGFRYSGDGGLSYQNRSFGMEDFGAGSSSKNCSAGLMLQNGSILLGLSDGIYSSTNKGLSWTNRHSTTFNIGAFCQTIAGAVYAVAGDGFHNYRPTSESSNPTRLLKSVDNGSTWNELPPTGLPDTLNASGLSSDPADANILFLSSTNGLFQSTNGGMNWNLIANGLMGDVIIPRTGRVLVAQRSSPSGIYAYTNNQYSLLTNITAPWALAVDPLNSNVIYAGSTDWSLGGLYRSDDGGTSWSKILHKTTNADDPGWISLAQNAVGADIVISGQDGNADGRSDCIYLTGNNTGKINKSTDGGVSWTNISCTADPDTNFPGYYFGKGDNDFTCVRNILINTNRPDEVWIGIYDWRTVCTYFASSTNPSFRWGTAIHAAGQTDSSAGACSRGLAIDYRDDDRVYISTGRSFTDPIGAVFRHEGENDPYSWNLIGGSTNKTYGLPCGAVNDLFIPEESNQLYAVVASNGIFRITLTNGTNWVGIGNHYMTNDAKIFYTITGYGNNLLLGTDTGLFKKTGTGAWSKKLAGLHVKKITIDPVDTNNIYCIAHGENWSSMSNGVYLSTNGGDTWIQLNTDTNIDAPTGLAVDPISTNRAVYVSTQNEGLLYLENVGGGWVLNTFATAGDYGLPTPWLGCVAAYSNIVYAGTQGFGTQRIDVRGNLIRNGDFDSPLIGWNTSSSALIVPGEGMDSSSALKLSNTDKATLSIRVIPGKNYRVKVRAKVEGFCGGSGAQILVQSAATYYPSSFTTDANYTALDRRITASTNTIKIILNANLIGSAYFDNLEMILEP